MNTGDRAQSAMSHAEDAPVRIVLFGSPDVLATIGRIGLLEARIGTGSVEREAPCRSDVLLQNLSGSDSRLNAELPHFEASVSRTAACDGDVTLVVLSLEPDLVGPAPWRHRDSGWLIQPPRDYERVWPPEFIDSLHTRFQRTQDLTTAQSEENLVRIARILSTEVRSVLVFNVSTYDPRDRTHRYSSSSDTYAVRAHRANASLEGVAEVSSLTIVDVDAAVAEVGGLISVPAAARLAADAVEFVTAEAILAVDDSGAIGGTLQAPVMTLRVPSFDRRTVDGVMATWHVRAGDEVTAGTLLFDVRFENKVYRFDQKASDGDGERRRSVVKHRNKRVLHTFDVSVVAGGEAVLASVLLPVGAPVSAGDVAGVMTAGAVDDASIEKADTDFRVGARMIAP